MAYTYTPSEDTILIVQDAARRIEQLEACVTKLSGQIAQVLKVARMLVDHSNDILIDAQLRKIENDRHAAALNAHADELERTEAVDDTEGPMNPEHLQYGH